MERRQFFRMMAASGAGAVLASGQGPLPARGDEPTADGLAPAGGQGGGPSRFSCDVAVVGGGLSGLTAATALAAAGVDVLVIEAQKRVGGRTLTVNRNGAFIDHGGQWVSDGQDRLMALAAGLGVSLFPTWHDGLTVDWNAGVRSTYTGLFPPYWTDQERASALGGVQALEQMAD